MSMSVKYFLISASRDHVLKGVEGGFAQSGHGKRDNISKLSKGDWIIYYSAKEKIDNKTPYQKFTAIGQITDDEPYQPDNETITNPNMNMHSIRPYRRNVNFSKAHNADIRPLIPKLHFIKNKNRWGFYLISGFRELSKEDFTLIQTAMT